MSILCAPPFLYHPPHSNPSLPKAKAPRKASRKHTQVTICHHPPVLTNHSPSTPSNDPNQAFWILIHLIPSPSSPIITHLCHSPLRSNRGKAPSHQTAFFPTPNSPGTSQLTYHLHLQRSTCRMPSAPPVVPILCFPVFSIHGVRGRPSKAPRSKGPTSPSSLPRFVAARNRETWN